MIEGKKEKGDKLSRSKPVELTPYLTSEATVYFAQLDEAHLTQLQHHRIISIRTMEARKDNILKFHVDKSPVSNRFIEELNESTVTAYVLTWEGPREPTDVEIGGLTIGRTRDNSVQSSDGLTIGSYIRILDTASTANRKSLQLMLVALRNAPQGF